MLPRRPPIITWTRFYLPREQEWPTWSVDGDDIYAGPFGEVEGYRNLSLGRLVDDPEQAAYIVGELVCERVCERECVSGIYIYFLVDLVFFY